MAHAPQNKVTRMRALVALPLLAMALGSCATADPAADPLKHTKKLVVEGHVSLYNNGAFNVPQTSIRLIPAGPSVWEIVGELMGLRARQAFLLAISRAKESVTILSEGTTLSYHMAEGIHQATGTSPTRSPRPRARTADCWRPAPGRMPRASSADPGTYLKRPPPIWTGWASR